MADLRRPRSSASTYQLEAEVQTHHMCRCSSLACAHAWADRIGSVGRGARRAAAAYAPMRKPASCRRRFACVPIAARLPVDLRVQLPKVGARTPPAAARQRTPPALHLMAGSIRPRAPRFCPSGRPPRRCASLALPLLVLHLMCGSSVLLHFDCQGKTLARH
jgi:hypothetical protein